MMIDQDSDVVRKLKEKYSQGEPPIHPLIIHRSVERAKSPGDLFDILHSLWLDVKEATQRVKLETGEEVEVCKAYPLVWHEEQHRWVKTEDPLQSLSFIAKQKEHQ